MDDQKTAMTIVAWIGYFGTTIYLANIMGAVAIPFAAIMMVPLIVLMSFLWNPKNARQHSMSSSASSTEKRKRERIDNMIRDMSDDELYELRMRLQDGSIDESVLYDRVVGDDGELVNRRR